MRIFSNLAISLDGKIATRKKGLHYLGTNYDRRQMQKIRLKADAILMGAETLRSFKQPCYAELKKQQPVNVILSSQLAGISPHWAFFKDPQIKRILFISQPLSPQRRRAFEATSEIILLKKPTRLRPISQQILDSLHQRKIKNLLIEGGGGVMWNFVEYNHIDEIYVTLTPHLIGGKTSPALVEGIGLLPSQVLNLKLHSCRRVKDELYLHYKKSQQRGLKSSSHF